MPQRVEKLFHSREARRFPCLTRKGLRCLTKPKYSVQGLLDTRKGSHMPCPSTDQTPPANGTGPASMASWIRGTSGRLVLGAGLVGALVAVLYHRILLNLVIDWWRVPDDSHGFLVPIFAGYVLWSRRVAIRQITAAPRWSGVAVVAVGLLVLLLGEFGANLFLSRISIVILLTGFVVCFAGWHLLRQVWFPILVLLIAIPIPALLLNHITFPLQLLASKVASDLLPIFSVPVLREGNTIQLSEMRLEVAEACSGIRSLVSLSATAIFYSYFVERSNIRRMILVLSSIPIAVTANCLRIVGTGICVQHLDPEIAMGFFHKFSGWVMFLISLVCLYFIQHFMSLFSSARRSS